MQKLLACDRCQYFANSPYIVCSLHPCGPVDDVCEDFTGVESAVAVRQPLGGGYYTGDWIPQPFPALTAAEQIALTDEHPQFTSRCPHCEVPIAEAAE